MQKDKQERSQVRPLDNGEFADSFFAEIRAQTEAAKRQAVLEQERLAANEQIITELRILQTGFGNVAAGQGELRQSVETIERYVRVEASRTKADMQDQEKRWLELTMQLGQQVALLDKSNKMLVEQLRMMFGSGGSDGEKEKQ